MSALDVAMRYYPYVCHPITVLGVGIAVVIHHEWAGQDADRSALWRRLGAFLGVGLVAVVPTAAFFLITGANPVTATQGNSWTMDALVASGLLIAAVGTWVLWRRREWGGVVPPMMEALAIVALPYAALSVSWNLSGHVLLSLVPTLYLTVIDRRYWPGLSIPAVMVPNRLYLDAHTLPQAVDALFVGAVVVLIVAETRLETGPADAAVPTDLTAERP